jgi:hypothetical protein
MNTRNSLPREDADFLSSLTRDVRSRPDRFCAGRAFLEREFTYTAILERRRRELTIELRGAEIANERALRGERASELRRLRRSRLLAEARALRATPIAGEIPILRAIRRDLAAFAVPESIIRGGHLGPRTIPREHLLRWASGRSLSRSLQHSGPVMSREHAEAVILSTVFFWDRSETPNAALPAFLDAIPWGSPESTSEDAEWLCHRWTAIFDPGVSYFPADLVLAARHAWARIQAECPPADSSSGAQANDNGVSGETRPTRAEAMALGGFEFACLQNPTLSTARARPEHWEHLREHAPQLLTGASRHSYETWRKLVNNALLKRDGRKRNRVSGIPKDQEAVPKRS